MVAVSPPSTLSPARRAQALASLNEDEVDLVIIGGGITGVGAALDAAARGMSVVLVERHDLASGTSSRSSKLIHGGLRYLEHLDLRLVFEALHERSAMLVDLAPGLVSPVPFVIPLSGPRWQRVYFGAGVALYDLLASIRGGNPLPRHRHLGRRSTKRLAPGVDTARVRGGIAFWDAQVDDARHTMLVARTAAAHGARICTRTEVVDLIRDDLEVCGVVVRDVESGAQHTVRARGVVNATGVWTEEIERLAGNEVLGIRAAKGVHLVVPRDRIDLDTGLVLRTEKSVLFVIPWLDHWLIGTTDTPWSADRDAPTVTAEDVTYLLDRVNAILVSPLTRDDIVGQFAGLRPLVDTTSRRRGHPREETTAIRREHVVHRVAPGLVTIAGGKYTTYRRMAAEVVDAVIASSPSLQPRFKTARSNTRRIPILGAHSGTNVGAPFPEFDPATVSLLAHRYGTLLPELRALLDESPALAAPLLAAPRTWAVEIVHAVTHEGARHLDDVLSRRTRLSVTSRDRANAAAIEVAALMAPLLGWDDTRRQQELDTYRTEVRPITTERDDASTIR